MEDQKSLKQSTLATMATPIFQLIPIFFVGCICIERSQRSHISLGFIETQFKVLYLSRALYNCKKICLGHTQRNQLMYHLLRMMSYLIPLSPHLICFIQISNYKYHSQKTVLMSDLGALIQLAGYKSEVVLANSLWANISFMLHTV